MRTSGSYAALDTPDAQPGSSHQDDGDFDTGKIANVELPMRVKRKAEPLGQRNARVSRSILGGWQFLQSGTLLNIPVGPEGTPCVIFHIGSFARCGSVTFKLHATPPSIICTPVLS
jgi:hypothetical protein